MALPCSTISWLILLLRISFKRKSKAPTNAVFSLPRLFTSTLLSTSTSSDNQQSTGQSSNSESGLRHRSGSTSTNVILSYLDRPGDAGQQLQDTKDASDHDWYVEGPGRRVGYDDLTAIDWIFEYAKERQRLRFLYASASGIIGQLQQLADASQIWVILIAAGIASGAVAAFIDVASDWLADLKTGHCRNVDGDGKFYLNKVFCCWGYTGTYCDRLFRDMLMENAEFAQCHDWSPWSSTLGVTAKGGSWIIEYIFFVAFSVGRVSLASRTSSLTLLGSIRGLRELSCQKFCALCEAQRDTRDKDGFGRIRNAAFFGNLDSRHQVTRFGRYFEFLG